MSENVLYYGDNLDMLRRHIGDESVDLVYLDPPFNSNATYNVLFAEQDGTQAAAQINAFEDTWRWDQGAERAYQETVETGGDVARALLAFRTLLGESNMMAYLAMMAPRLVELRRVLKPTGSIYLHCDPTASHYLKLLMDAVFGPRELPERDHLEADQRAQRHQQDASAQRSTTSLLFYARSRRDTWNHAVHAVRRGLRRPRTTLRWTPTGGDITSGDLSVRPAPQSGDHDYEWHGRARQRDGGLSEGERWTS